MSSTILKEVKPFASTSNEIGTETLLFNNILCLRRAEHLFVLMDIFIECVYSISIEPTSSLKMTGQLLSGYPPLCKYP